MKKLGLIITGSIILFACGSNAENNVTATIEKEIGNTIIEGVIEEEVAEDIIIEEITEKEPATKEKQNLEEAIEIRIEKVKEVVTEVIEEEKPLVVEVIRAKHNTWNNLAKKYVTATGKVNYKGMKAEINTISTYLKHLQHTAPKGDWSKNEKLAYWINLYNASTVYLIASNYPTSSITKLNGGKPWDKKFVKSGDKTYSLNDIENNIVRPRFKDPRIHAALNCAAVSCPKMMNEAFLPSKLSAQLDKQAKAWINDSGRNKLTNNKVNVSQIFDWYKVDFKAGGGVVAFINKYATTKVSNSAKISYLEYNWALNE